MTTDAQTALAHVREALAAGPTPGEWACYDDSNDGKTSRIEIVAIGKTVARIYRSVPEQDLPNARLIAACSPANIAAILAHVDAQAAEIERLRAERDSIAIENSKFMDQIERLTEERDNACERCERTANLLVGTHALLCPPPLTLADGRTLVFRPKNPDPHTVLQTLSDRIRALPDEIAAINDAKEQK